jgi:hypothetical protein
MCFSAIFTSFPRKKLSAEKFRIIFSRLKVRIIFGKILKLPLHLGSWHYIWKFCIIFEIWYYMWEVDMCDKIDITFGNFVLYLWVLLCLRISHYIWEFRIIFVNLLLYLGISHYICEFVIIFANFALYLHVCCYIFEFRVQYSQLVLYFWSW